MPVTVKSAPSPLTKPSPPTVTSSLVSGSPLYSRLEVPEVNVTSRFWMVSLPAWVLTLNWSVTTLPSASLTTAVPVTTEAYSPASVPLASAERPSTV